MRWNGRAQLVEYTDCSGKSTRYAYDGRGMLASVTGALGNATVYHTDALGRVTDVVDPEGGVQRFEYDELGRKTWQDTTRQDTHEQVLRKKWEYDRAGELVRKVHSRNGQTRYHYDALGRIVGAMDPAGNEFFEWDAAANLVDTQQVGGYVKYNRVTVYQDKRYEYDVHGRMETKRIGRHTEQNFRYDGEHRLREVHTVRNGVEQVVYFDYDALGRRIRKRDAFGETLFLWDGLQMIQEQRGGNVATYLYEPGTYVPLARVDLRDKIRNESSSDIQFRVGYSIESSRTNIFFFHNSVAGAPEELLREDSPFVWAESYRTWGNTAIESSLKIAKIIDSSLSNKIEQNLRYQGQYSDSETGLHYNTFRYYDPDIGRFITPDPIDLKGGLNSYQYAANPISWTDPLGLEKCRMSKSDKAAIGNPPASLTRPHLHHIVREKAPKNWSQDARKYIEGAQKIAQKHSIDINMDPRNFTWAENGGGAHTVKAAEHVFKAVQRGDIENGKLGVEEALAQLGKDMSNGIFFK